MNACGDLVDPADRLPTTRENGSVKLAVRPGGPDPKALGKLDLMWTTWRTSVLQVCCSWYMFSTFLANQLTDTAPPHCEYTDSPGRFLPVVDKLYPRVYTHEDCRRQCDSEPEFQCRAFSFHAYRRDCLLSSDDTHSSGVALVSDQEFFYGERGSCNNGKT